MCKLSKKCADLKCNFRRTNTIKCSKFLPEEIKVKVYFSYNDEGKRLIDTDLMRLEFDTQLMQLE